MPRVEIETKKLIFEDFFKIEEAVLRYKKFDGSMSEPVRRLNFLRGDSVAAVVFNEDTQRVLLTHQFKYPTHEKGPGWISELVAGAMEPNETAEDSMRREILEEIGYRVRELKKVATFYVSPGGTSERIILFYAAVKNSDGIERGGGLESEGEDIRIVELSLSELEGVVERGQIQDAKTLIGLMWLHRERGMGA